MRKFAQLINSLIQSKSSNDRISVLKQHFELTKTEDDQNQTLNLLLGNTPKRTVTLANIESWMLEITDYPKWLIDRSKEEVGNTLQTICLLLRSTGQTKDKKSLSEYLKTIDSLQNAPDEKIIHFISRELVCTDSDQRSILLKLLTGTFKSPVSKMEIINSIALRVGLKPEIVSLRLLELENKQQVSMNSLSLETEDEFIKIPLTFPEFRKMNSFEENNWYHEKYIVFGKRYGIEAQLVKHGETVHLWTREGELVTEKFPELIDTIPIETPNFISFGQILQKNDDSSVESITARIHKKRVTKKDVSMCEAAFELWDVLDGDKENLFPQLYNLPNISQTKIINFSSMQDLIAQHKNCRKSRFNGYVLKHEDKEVYNIWKATSFSAKAILMYVEFGGTNTTGIRSLTLGAYNHGELIPIAKIMNFPHFFDIEEIARFVKENTIERFGPVRTVAPKLVYEFQFEGISRSSRRKSGLILSNPTIIRNVDIEAPQVNQLEYYLELL